LLFGTEHAIFVDIFKKGLQFMYKRYYKIVFLITTLVVFYLAITASDTSWLNSPYEDKINHFMAFFTLSLLLNRASSRPMARIRNVIALLSFGIFIEYVQSFLPYRDASMLDVLADLCGILLFQSALTLYRFTKVRLLPEPTL
jgi:VanZ family protein